MPDLCSFSRRRRPIPRRWCAIPPIPRPGARSAATKPAPAGQAKSSSTATARWFRRWTADLLVRTISGACAPGGARSASPRLRAVITLDDDEIAGRRILAQLHRLAIFGRVVAGFRGFIILGLDHHVARAGAALA